MVQLDLDLTWVPLGTWVPRSGAYLDDGRIKREPGVPQRFHHLLHMQRVAALLVEVAERCLHAGQEGVELGKLLSQEDVCS